MSGLLCPSASHAALLKRDGKVGDDRTSIDCAPLHISMV